MPILIDEKGRQLGPPIPKAKSRSIAEADEIATAVRSRGWVYIEQTGRSLVVMFRPALVSNAAIAGTYYVIYQHLPERVLLSYGLNEDSAEIFTDLETAIRRIEELSRIARLPALKTGITGTRQSLEVIKDIADGKMNSLLNLWGETGGRWSAELYTMLRRATLLSDTLIVRNPIDGDDFRIEHWGSKRQIFGREWARTARGRDIREQPSPQLTDWVISTLREARAEGQPRLDDVKAVVVTPHGLIRRRHYHRLLLPFQSASGETLSVVVNVTREADAPAGPRHQDDCPSDGVS